MIGIYLHLPYCPTKCAYCDFNAYLAPSAEAFERYAQALLTEIDLACEAEGLGGTQVGSVYFGGGTPTLFPAGDLAHLLEALAARFSLTADCEVTVEANPSGLTTTALGVLRRAGANRLSIGAQTFDDALLQKIGRDHTAQDIARAVESADAAGFRRVNLDLMYGLPGEDDDTILQSGRRAIALGVEHMSLYALELEPATVFGRLAAKGRLALPPEEAVTRRGDALEALLEGAGLHRYEVSNYARTGARARHNLHTWQRGRYRGFGAGAHSFLGERRFWNVRHPARYEGLLEKRRLPIAGGEDVAPIARGEWAYLALRTFRLPGAGFRAAFGGSLEAAFPKTLGWALREGWLEHTGEDYTVPKARRWLLNQVAAPFLDEGKERPPSEAVLTPRRAP